MHKIYDPDTSSGLTLSKTQYEDLQLSFSCIYGFMPTEFLEEILAKPECVGIRFHAVKYHSVHRVVACGVSSRGFDFRVYYNSQKVLENIHARPFAKSFDKIWDGERYIKTSAFFSKNDLENMLLSDEMDGLTIYLANLTRIKDIIFSVDHSLIAFRTTLIVEKAKTQEKDNRANVKDKELEVKRMDIPLPPQIEGNILSLYPYPGHGAQLDYLISQNIAESSIHRGHRSEIYAPLNNGANKFSKLYKTF